MNKDIEEILARYKKGQQTGPDQVALEKAIEDGLVQVEELTHLEEIQSKINAIEVPEPSDQMTAGFYEKLVAHKAKKYAFLFTRLENLWVQKPSFKYAYTIILLVIGIIGGYLLRSPQNNQQLDRLSTEVTQMKEMMMLSLLEKESTSDRLKAVNLTSEIPDASTSVTGALLKTLNNDENVNVRLATIEALYPYSADPKVRKGLIEAIAKQESPMVQMALAEMMVALQEKRSVSKLKQLLDREETPQEVKQQIEESIKVLI